ncbi:TPA: DUF4124 domain-containing protein, partial [Legionella pneumophila]|nr:DUF4124 domain-containing protein [Legionella pneumophila]
MKYFNMIVIVLFLVFTGMCFGEIYKWTDDKGVVHFGDHPGSNASPSEKIYNVKNSGTHSQSKNNNLDTELLTSVDKLIEKASEINKDAESCLYNAMEKKEIDISCKNFYTVVNRDFKPILFKMENMDYTKTSSKNELSGKLEKVQNILRQADKNYTEAMSILLNELEVLKEQLRSQLLKCYSDSLRINAVDSSCQTYLDLYGRGFKPLSEKMKGYAEENDYLRNKVEHIETTVNELNNKYRVIIQELSGNIN